MRVIKFYEIVTQAQATTTREAWSLVSRGLGGGGMICMLHWALRFLLQLPAINCLHEDNCDNQNLTISSLISPGPQRHGLLSGRLMQPLYTVSCVIKCPVQAVGKTFIMKMADRQEKQ